MRSLASPVIAVIAAALASALVTPSAFADTPIDGVVVAGDSLDSMPTYPVLTRGEVLLVNAQRFVVTQEPPPVARVADAPPEQPGTAVEIPAAPQAGAIWVEPHWAYGASGFTWIAGSYVAPRAGHVFVPPRWASAGGEYMYFNGFYVPRGVYVRSHFNRYYYSGVPVTQSASSLGPYWPIGAPVPGNSGSPRAHDPYWPIGAPR